MLTNKKLKQIQAYELPENIAPDAPRKPFEAFSLVALYDAVCLTQKYSNKKGMLSNAWHDITNMSQTGLEQKTVTIESHIDSTKLPQYVADKLIKLGLEPDGFTAFNTAHFSEHFTLKFKSNKWDKEDQRNKRAFIKNNSILAFEILEACNEIKEAYVEIEVYTSDSREIWDGTFKEGWQKYFPLKHNALMNKEVPCFMVKDAKKPQTKKCDIHLKIEHKNNEEDRHKLINLLSDAGFYPVHTWGGNDVCTAQFLNMRDAKTIFNLLSKYFSEYGGCSEMTQETVKNMWRSQKQEKLASVPPLIHEVHL